MPKEQSKNRMSNLELLRIVATVIIVLSHYLKHGADFTAQEMTFQSVFRDIFVAGGVGVICFVLISGYFMTEIKTVSLKKLFRTWFPMFFFSVVIELIAFFTLPERGLMDLVTACLPGIFYKWWFATTFLVLSLFAPYINRLLGSLDKGQYKKLILLLTVLWCLIPTFTNQAVELSNLAAFIALYAIAGYLKRYPLANEMKIGILIFGGGCLWIVGAAVAGEFLGQYSMTFWRLADYFNEWTKLPQWLEGIGLFLIFKNLPIKQSKFINTVSAACFCVYLIHDHPIARELLWQKWLYNGTYHHSPMFFLHCIGSVALVYAVCTVIGIAYKFLLEPLVFKVYDKAESGIKKIAKK